MSRDAPSTLQDFIDRGWSLFVSCSNYHACFHSADVQPARLAPVFGPGFDLYAGRNTLRRRLRCSRCGKHWPELRLTVVASGMWRGDGGHGLSNAS